MKTIAMYLPQFHRIPENDAWWGEGFTEWTAVKAAKPLFAGHMQPNVPYGAYYYDLSEKSTMEWQAALAKKYRLDGFCFYHYYFKNGRKILEKPAQQLLQWKDIDMPFCFCWANETWARTWSNVGDKNSWGDKFETERANEHAGSGVLLEQDYGEEDAWEKHFYELLPYFTDRRYITCEGRPVFLLYKPEKIFCLQRMLECWDNLAKREGIPRPYIVGVNINHAIRGVDAVLLLGPSAYRDVELSGRLNHTCRKEGVTVEPYGQLCNAGAKAPEIDGTTTYFSVVAGYDDTPRRGNGGCLVEGRTPELFAACLDRMLEKSAAAGNQFLFLNAWNEWGEGMYLEPDERNGFRYLEAVKRSVERLESCTGEPLEEPGRVSPETADMRKRIAQFRKNYELLNHWLTLKGPGRSISQYLSERSYNRIAVYGWGELGKRLCEELKEAEIEVVCIIDRCAKPDGKTVSVDEFREEFYDISAVVVTAIYDFDNIYHVLRGRVSCPILSLEEVVWS